MKNNSTFNIQHTRKTVQHSTFNIQHSTFSTPCILFAGGRSSRMGSDKALLPFGGSGTLSEYQYQRLSKIFERVYISAKENKFNFDAPLIKDIASHAGYAPTIGLLSAFEFLADDYLFVLSVDTPFVQKEQIERLILKIPLGHEAIVAKSPSGTHPLCALYSRKILPKLEKMVLLGDHRLHSLLERIDTLTVDFDDEEPFFNLNRPHEYEKALHTLEQKRIDS